MIMKYNKLVRDNIPEIIKQKGERALWHTASEEEYEKKLKEKLFEEAEEFFEDPNAEEFADVLEVIDALCEFYAINPQSAQKIQKEKKEKRGGFQQRIILDES